MTSQGTDSDPEVDAVRARYGRRASDDPRYSLLDPTAMLMLQERQRAMLRLFARVGITELGRMDIVEVGSGDGGNLLDLLRMGCAPARLLGIELLPERHEAARARLPEAVQLWLGDASIASLDPASCDIVFASTVFSSLLDDAFQHRLADAMWRWLKPGGGILWYDFIVNNPRNPDVRGVPLGRIRELFPEGRLQFRRLTLAPPIARAVTRVHPAFYTLFNAVSMLRTHVLAWIEKPTTSN